MTQTKGTKRHNTSSTSVFREPGGALLSSSYVCII